MFGVKSFFRTDEYKDQFVGTFFIYILIPIIPSRSFYSIGKSKYPIPSNRKNILKNFLATYCLLIGIILLLFNFILDEPLLFNAAVNPYNDQLRDLGFSLDTLEKSIAFILLTIGIYFASLFGELNRTEKEDIALIQESRFAYTILPGRKLIPALGRYYEKDDVRVLINQMMILIFKIYFLPNEFEKERLKLLDHEELIEEYKARLRFLIESEKFKKGSLEGIAFLLLTTINMKILHKSAENINFYNIVKNHLLAKNE